MQNGKRTDNPENEQILPILYKGQKKKNKAIHLKPEQGDQLQTQVSGQCATGPTYPPTKMT